MADNYIEAKQKSRTPGAALKIERAMGFEPTTSCLGSKRSTTDLRPHHATAFRHVMCTPVAILPRTMGP